MSDTIPLIELFKDNYTIPHYQRGYRWEKQEVTELLDDLWNFCKDRETGDFYCLQPIVLQKNPKGDFDVLDGQQRLTTLYLLLAYLEESRFENGFEQSLFSINYATREHCEKFLVEKKFARELDDSNIDFYHMCQAYKSIDEWFKDVKHRGAKVKLVPILMDDNSKGNRNVRFIRYEVEQTVNPIEVFVRLNVGKIPLTDAELTKALLMQSDKYPHDDLKYIGQRLFEIATEWDNIEYTLQEDAFWYFLNNHANDRPTHIEFIFDLMARKIQKKEKYFASMPLKHSTFLVLSAYLEDLIDNDGHSRIGAVGKIWNQVTSYFEYFRDWFQNRKLYHFIGFLIAEQGSHIIDSLIEKSEGLSKAHFEGYLQKEIAELTAIRKKTDEDGNEYEVELKDLLYEDENTQTDDKREIQRIILMHNVYTTWKSAKEQARFPFNLYKGAKRKEKWSLEHIHAQNSENITKQGDQTLWLNDHIRFFLSQNNSDFEELIANMKELCDSDVIEMQAFEEIANEVYDAIRKQSGADAQNVHSISNLCLVDVPTNSRMNNSVFDVKREIIKKRELEGYYIPICTRNVFLKAYTEYPSNNAYWTGEDRKGYLRNIQNAYDYFAKTMTHQ